MSRTEVKSFYEKNMEDLTRAINAHVKSSGSEITSIHVFKSPQNAWYEAIVVFEKPLVISIEQVNELKAAFEADPNDQGSRPISVLG